MILINQLNSDLRGVTDLLLQPQENDFNPRSNLLKTLKVPNHIFRGTPQPAPPPKVPLLAASELRYPDNHRHLLRCLQDYKARDTRLTSCS